MYFFKYDSWIQGARMARGFVQGLTDGLLPAGFLFRNSFGDNDENLNEEKKMFYVAVTRAKVLLYISSYIESQSNVFMVKH